MPIAFPPYDTALPIPVPVAAPPYDAALPTPVPVAVPPAPPVTTTNPAGHEQTGHYTGATEGAVGVELVYGIT